MGQEMVVEGDLGAAAGRSGTYFVAKTPPWPTKRNLGGSSTVTFEADRSADELRFLLFIFSFSLSHDLS